MIARLSPIEWALASGLLGLVLWLVAMCRLRGMNFKSGARKDKDKRKLSEHLDLLSQQIEYQNKATYRALEFYLKVLLAVLGGIGYVVLSKNSGSQSARLLVNAAGWIIVLVSGLFCAMTLSIKNPRLSDGSSAIGGGVRYFGMRRGSLLRV